ncbi:HNH endonuclease [Escherichia coli]|uniref:HNH endonuclease n=1 Tax=Escherichia coli TaxID=562 RepID=UPI001A922F9C|nr:HNH endonuclease [Escherichia coli]MBO0272618.1 HNH endonuclease [Escherichia coli]
MKYLGDFIKNLPCSWLEVAKNSKKENAQQFKFVAEEISECYGLYDDLINSYNVKLPDSSLLQHSELLIEYYEKAPSGLNKLLLKRRNEHDLSYCPYCGNPMTPDTLDHFIPKGKWPEFSIFPNNLVPQCRGCAPVKGEHYFSDDNNSVIFIHPMYFDFLENFRFSLHVSLNAEGNGISICVKLRKIKDTQECDQNRIILHVEKLKIKTRIISYCHKDFNQWKRRLSNKNFDVRTALQQRLMEIPQSEIGKDWQSAFYYALLQNQEVIDYMNSLCPKLSVEQQLNVEEELDFR